MSWIASYLAAFQYYEEAIISKYIKLFATIRGQTVHWIGAQFCVIVFLDSGDKYLNMFQNVSGFHLQDLRGFRVHILVTQILPAHLICCGFRSKQI